MIQINSSPYVIIFQNMLLQTYITGVMYFLLLAFGTNFMEIVTLYTSNIDIQYLLWPNVCTKYLMIFMKNNYDKIKGNSADKLIQQTSSS